MKATLNEIIEKLTGSYDSNDFNFNTSICEDGRVSMYANSSFGIKVRMSNHSVLSNSRILNEVHLQSFKNCGSVEGCVTEWKKYFDMFYGRK
jgi:hypothetical protein